MLRLPAVHPGEVLRSEFMLPLNLSSRDLSALIHVPRSVIDELIAGRRPLCADLAIRLTEHFAMGERFWLGLQADYELEIAHRARERAAAEAACGCVGLSTDLG